MGSPGVPSPDVVTRCVYGERGLKEMPDILQCRSDEAMVEQMRQTPLVHVVAGESVSLCGCNQRCSRAAFEVPECQFLLVGGWLSKANHATSGWSCVVNSALSAWKARDIG